MIVDQTSAAPSCPCWERQTTCCWENAMPQPTRPLQGSTIPTQTPSRCSGTSSPIQKALLTSFRINCWLDILKLKKIHMHKEQSEMLISLQVWAQGRQCTAKPNERSCFESTKCPYSSQNGKFVRCPQASQAKHKPHACHGTGAQTLLLLMWQSHTSSHTNYQNAEFLSLKKKSKSTVKMSHAWVQGQLNCIPSNGTVLPFFWERRGRKWDPTYSISSSIYNLNVQQKNHYKCLK